MLILISKKAKQCCTVIGKIAISCLLLRFEFILKGPALENKNARVPKKSDYFQDAYLFSFRNIVADLGNLSQDLVDFQEHLAFSWKFIGKISRDKSWDF